MKVWIGKKGLKDYPPRVADKIRAIAEQFHVSRFEARDELPTHWFYVAEGHRYYGMYSDGKGYGFDVVAEHNLGAAGLSHAIGEEFSMPSGTYLVEIEYYTRWLMTVYRIVGDSEAKLLERDTALPIEVLKSNSLMFK